MPPRPLKDYNEGRKPEEGGRSSASSHKEERGQEGEQYVERQEVAGMKMRSHCKAKSSTSQCNLDSKGSTEKLEGLGVSAS